MPLFALLAAMCPTAAAATCNHLPDRPLPFESNHRFNRRMAVKYNLDFTVRCVFPEQISHYDHPCLGKTCRIPMRSGRTAEFLVVQVESFKYGDTGQADYHFEFQRYL